MRALDIALRDMLRSTRSAFALMFMFVVPLLIVGLMQFIMGGALGGDGDITVPVTNVQVVNLDRPFDVAGGAAPELAGGEEDAFSVGEMLIDLLASDDLADLVAVSRAESESEARAAVDAGEAGVALIIPPDLTQAIVTQDGETSITLYSDPTLTVGPGIVKGLINLFVDAFSGSKIAVRVAAEQLEAEGLEVSADVMQEITAAYVAWTSTHSETQQVLDLQPVGSQPTTSMGQRMLGGITAGMLVFYVFFTGSATAQSIINEEEEGTLRRLFTAPISVSTILTGKVMASLLTLSVQVIVLLLASSLLFGINWGRPLPVLLAAAGLILMAASFGLFVMSLVKGSSQVGAVYGGLLTITGMIGIFTAFVPNISQRMSTVALVVPQGWAMRAWVHVMGGGGLTTELFLPFGLSLVISAVFFGIGVMLFGRRFA